MSHPSYHMSAQHPDQLANRLAARQDEWGNSDQNPPPSPTEAGDEADVCMNHILHVRPKSAQALSAFNMLCETLDSQPRSSHDEHYEKFVGRDPGKSTLRQAVGHWDDAGSSGDDSAPRDTPEQLIQTGWRIGYGKQDFGPVDLHVCQNSRWPGLRGYHAAFKFNKEGQLCFEAYRSGVKLDGGPVRQAKPRPLSKTVHYANFAKVLDYELRFVGSERSRYYQKEARRLFVQEYLQYPAPNELTPVTPSEYGTQRGDWLIGDIIGQGGKAPHTGRTLIRVGSHYRESKELVAVKESYYITPEDHWGISKEIETYGKLATVLPKDDEDRALIVRLLDTIPSKLPDFVPGNANSISLIFSPLGRQTLESTLGED